MSPSHLARRASSPVARLVLAAVLAGSAALLAVPASAGPVGFDVSGGWYTQVEEPMVGAGLRVSLATLTLHPNAEYLFVDSGNVYTVNGDVHWNVLPLPMASVWVGGGLGMWVFDPESDLVDSETRTAVNLLAGAGLGAAPLKPFAQLKYVLLEESSDPLALTVGVRF